MALKDTKRALLSRGIKETAADALIQADYTMGRLRKATLEELKEHLSEESALDVMEKLDLKPDRKAASGGAAAAADGDDGDEAGELLDAGEAEPEFSFEQPPPKAIIFSVDSEDVIETFKGTLEGGEFLPQGGQFPGTSLHVLFQLEPQSLDPIAHLPLRGAY